MVNSIINANAYLNGNKLAGKLAELELPAIKLTMQEVKALGLFGVAEIPSGLEKMEAKFKWNAIYPAEWKQESPTSVTKMIVKGNMMTVDASGVKKNSPATATIHGLFKELPSGTIKPGEAMDGQEHLMAVTYYKLEAEGEEIYEVDIYNNIFKQGGKDLLSDLNGNQ
jgi:P2 family phage contractile tail tube protein